MGKLLQNFNGKYQSEFLQIRPFEEMLFSVYLYKYLMLVTTIYRVIPKVWNLIFRKALNVPSG